MSEINSFIAISDDFLATFEELKSEYGEFRLVDFIRDNFVVEDAKSVVKEAFISELKTKVIFLAANSFNIYSQNSLLKILEEPPRNITFIVCAPSKSTLLPTIRSRLPMRVFSKKAPLKKSGLDFTRLSSKDVYEFLQANKYASNHELENIIQSVVKEAIESGMSFKDSELETFSRLLRLASLNSKAHTILPTLFSIILNKALS